MQFRCQKYAVTMVFMSTNICMFSLRNHFYASLEFNFSLPRGSRAQLKLATCSVVES